MNPRDLLLQRFQEAVAAVAPDAAVRRWLRIEENHLCCGAWRHPLDALRDIVVIGAGKASAPMARAVEDLLGDRVTRGVVVVKYGHTLPLRRIQLLEAGHPIPDAAGVAAAAHLEKTVHGLSPEDLVLCCLSGGASALLPAPRPPLTLSDKQAVTRLLMGAGCSISQANTVRKHLSRLKGGRLARCCAPAHLLTLAISDVPGDDPATIGSGPTVPDAGSDDDAAAILRAHLDADEVPASVWQALEGGRAWTVPPEDPVWRRAYFQIVASNALAIAAIPGAVVAPALTGEAREAAERFCAFAAAQPPGTLVVAGGETTIVLGPNPGKGGRSQEFALAAARWIHEQGVPLTVLAAGTDGNDGPTDAAGGIVDGLTWARDPNALRHLDAHDPYPLLRRLDALVVTGPTHTNVMDLALAWRA